MKSRIIKHGIKWVMLSILLASFLLLILATQRAFTAQQSIPDVIKDNIPLDVTNSEQKHITVMTLNAAHGRGLSYNQLLLNRNTIAENLVNIANSIRQQDPDIVAIQEIDGPSFWSGGFNQVNALARHSGFPFYHRGKHGQMDTWKFTLSSGTALTSKTELNEAKSHAFNLSWRDNKGYVVATILSPIDNKKKIDVVSLHTDFLNAWMREEQLKVLSDELKARGNSVIVMGDFNCDFSAKINCVKDFSQRLNLKAYQPEESMATFPADDPDLRLDWILISSDLNFKSYRILSKITSDHLALVAEITH